MRIWALVIAIAAAVIGLVYFGVISKSQVRATAYKVQGDITRTAQEAANGFHGERSKDPKAAAQCRDMLKRIESAKRAVAQERSQTVGVVAWDDVLKRMGMKSIPRCPAGGSYSLNSLQQAATCSIGGNQTSSIHEDDHIIQGF